MRYEINDVHTRKNLTVYITIVIIATKNCEQDETEFVQVLHA